MRGLLTHLCFVLFLLIAPAITGYGASAHGAFQPSFLNQKQTKANLDLFESVELEPNSIDEKKTEASNVVFWLGYTLNNENAIGSIPLSGFDSLSINTCLSDQVVFSLLVLTVMLWMSKGRLKVRCLRSAILDPPRSRVIC